MYLGSQTLYRQHLREHQDIGSYTIFMVIQRLRGCVALTARQRLPNTPARIELRAPSAPSARLAPSGSTESLADARLEPTVLSSAYGVRRVLA